jgi:hypothetical protein
LCFVSCYVQVYLGCTYLFCCSLGTYPMTICLRNIYIDCSSTQTCPYSWQTKMTHICRIIQMRPITQQVIQTCHLCSSFTMQLCLWHVDKQWKCFSFSLLCVQVCKVWKYFLSNNDRSWRYVYYYNDCIDFGLVWYSWPLGFALVLEGSGVPD